MNLAASLTGAIFLAVVVGYDCAQRLAASRLLRGAAYLLVSALGVAGISAFFGGTVGASVSGLALLFGMSAHHAIRNSLGGR